MAPRVYHVSDRYEYGTPYYVMEALDPAPRTPNLLASMEALLSEHVWQRPVYFGPRTDGHWIAALEAHCGVTVPAWWDDSHGLRCLMHGDPTVSNVMARGDDIVLIDPVWFREYVPSCAGADRGKLLQSAAGWEVIAYDEERVEYVAPRFALDYELWREALFWCAVNMKRVLRREEGRYDKRGYVMQWCREVFNICLEMME